MPRDATLAARLAGDFRSDYYEIAVQALPDDLSQAFVDDRVATGGVSDPTWSLSLPWETQCTIAVTLRVRDLAIT